MACHAAGYASYRGTVSRIDRRLPPSLLFRDGRMKTFDRLVAFKSSAFQLEISSKSTFFFFLSFSYAYDELRSAYCL